MEAVVAIKYFPLLLTLIFSSVSLFGQEQKVDAKFLYNYYEQDGNNSPVTGGIGTEELSFHGPSIVVNVALDSVSTFHFDGGGSNIAQAFDFGRDAIYAKGLDKVGHFYGARITSDIFARGIRWSGKTEAQSLLWGGLLGTAVQGFIEIKDGYSPTWGFSVYDWMSGSLGSFYPYFQSKSRFLKALDIKYM
mgnify:CR=1 FL=1